LCYKPVTVTEQELFDTLFGRLCDSKDAHYAGSSKWMGSKEFLDKTISEKERDKLRTALVPPIYEVEAYAELAKDIEFEGHHGEGRTKIPAGTTMRVVMASRLGDLGITRDLSKQHGYETRVLPGDNYLTNCRLTKKLSI
jgi:hypothetical protein